MPRLSCFNANSIKTYGYSPYFPEFASVSFKKTFSHSTTASTSSACQELENARIESCNSNLFDCEQFDSFTSFKIKIADDFMYNQVCFILFFVKTIHYAFSRPIT